MEEFKKTVMSKNTIAVLIAFAMGLTLGNIRTDGRSASRTDARVSTSITVDTENQIVHESSVAVESEQPVSANEKEAHEEHTSSDSIIATESIAEINTEALHEQTTVIIATTEKETEINTETPSVETTQKITQETKQQSKADKTVYKMYKTPTGKRYHFSLRCAGENGLETTYEEAVSLGLTPCKKCADG